MATRLLIGAAASAFLLVGVADGKARFGDIKDWYVTGPGDGAPNYELTDYEGGLDRKIKYSGEASAYLRSKVRRPAKHAVVMQSIRSDKYKGKRIRLSAWVKTRKVADYASLWVRVVPLDRDKTLSRAADSTDGTTDWTRREVVVDVPQESRAILYGLSLHGAGRAWIDDATWEVVDKSVPLTSASKEPTEPSNLDFESER